MRKVRGVLVAGVVIALTLGITAIPGSAAPEKIFSLQAPGSVPTGTQSISLKLANETPSGNSSINSLKITVSGGVTINSASAPSGQVTTTPTGIAISNISPIKNKQSYTITANVTATAAGCSGSATWDTQSWTGSSFSGDTFRLLRTEINPNTGTPYSNLTTAITRSCSLRFNPAPVDSRTGTDIPVTVQIVSGSVVVTGFTGTITLSATPSISGTGSAAITNGTASADFTLNGSAIGSYTATASSAGLTPVSASFTLSDALLDCTAQPGDSSRLYQESGTAGTATITLTSTGNCTTSIPVSVDASQQGFVTVTKPDVTGSMYELTIDWTVTPNTDYPLATQIDTGSGFVPMVGCLASPTGPTIPGGQLWCVSDSHTYVNTTKHLVETYIGTKDVTFKRNP
jgi:hypothetical protein